MSDQRTEQATPQRKKKARDRGDVVRSRELLSGGAMLAGLVTLGSVSGSFVDQWRECYSRLTRLMSASPVSEWGVRDLMGVTRAALLPAMLPVVYVLCASMLAVLLLGVVQGNGVQLRPESLAFKWERFHPGTHIKQLFSARTAVRLAKSLLPALVIAYWGWELLQQTLINAPVMSLNRLPGTILAAFGLAVKTAWVLVVWSGIDYVVEWRSWNQRLKMSKQEIRDEVKESLGNPQIKGKIRQMQRAMAKRKAKVDMRRASVVVTNPTHYAVALEFSFEEMSAPTVLTKGRDLLAFDIREEARAAGVPIIENPPLARSLYRSVEAGQQIPYELYAAVAGILAYLFREREEAKMREARHRQQAQQGRNTAAAPLTSLRGFAGGM